VLNRRGFFRSTVAALITPFLAPRRSRAAISSPCPYLQNVGRDGATISWTTDRAGQDAVWLASGGSPAQIKGSVVTELSPVETGLGFPCYRHTVELAGLEPNTEYFYGFLHENGELTANEPLSFRTACPGALSFLAFGDSGSGSAEQQILASWMRRENPSLVLHLGDLAYPTGSFQDFLAYYFDPCRDLMKRVPFFPCPGNHDYMTRDAFPYLALHDLPHVGSVPESDRGRYYSFDWGNVHFVSVDSNAPLVLAAGGHGPMLEWLENDLRTTRQYWKIVYFHHPPFAGGPNENDASSELARRYLVPIVERHGVQLVLNGHEHSYQRTYPLTGKWAVPEGRGTVYVTSGGGGYGLYAAHSNPLVAVRHSVHHYLRVNVSNSRLSVRAIGLSGEEVDGFDLAPLPEVSDSVEILPTSDIAPTRVLRIHGRNLAAVAQSALGTSQPFELSGTSVTANGVPLPLLKVSTVDVEAQFTGLLEGHLELQVTTPNGVASKQVSVLGASRGREHTDPDLRKRQADYESFRTRRDVLLD
jgi:predicted MPP superfamily phosphohydrolase